MFLFVARPGPARPARARREDMMNSMVEGRQGTMMDPWGRARGRGLPTYIYIYM